MDKDLLKIFQEETGLKCFDEYEDLSGKSKVEPKVVDYTTDEEPAEPIEMGDFE